MFELRPRRISLSLGVGVLWVVDQDRVIVEEDCLGLLERHAMTSKIGACLPLVPLKPEHPGSVNTMYVRRNWEVRTTTGYSSLASSAWRSLRS